MREGIDTDALTGPCPIEELPYRQVWLSSYWIDRHEVSKGELASCISADADLHVVRGGGYQASNFA